MEVKGKLEFVSETVGHDTVITVSTKDLDLDDLGGLQGQDISFAINKYHPKRSLNANAFLWALCGEIARKVGSDKDSIYIFFLQRYGTFEIREYPTSLHDLVKENFRHVEIDHRWVETMLRLDGCYDEVEWLSTKCYKGSHLYDQAEMSQLLSGIISEANLIGVDTCSTDEFKSLIKSWKKRG